MADKENSGDTKLKNVDEGLNELILRKYDKLIDAYSSQEYTLSYNLMKSLFYLIKPYDFTGKRQLEEVFDEIEEYKKNMKTPASLNKATMINIGNQQYNFGLLVDRVYRDLPSAFSKLGKWMQIIKQYNDIDEQISSEVFNTDKSFIKEKKEELAKLPQKELLSYFNNNAVHSAHSRYLIVLGGKNGNS